MSKYLALPDPQTTGSKNPGSANMLRNAGVGPAIVTLIFDLSKGYFPVLTAQYLDLNTPVTSLVAITSILGHIFPVFHKFKGGKGVAAALGILIAINPWFGCVFASIWMAIAFASGYASVASLTALCLSLSICVYLNFNYLWLAIALFSIVLACHYRNIMNLASNQENKLKF